jgi:hypothetical protein
MRAGIASRIEKQREKNAVSALLRLKVAFLAPRPLNPYSSPHLYGHWWWLSESEKIPNPAPKTK